MVMKTQKLGFSLMSESSKSTLGVPLDFSVKSRSSCWPWLRKCTYDREHLDVDTVELVEAGPGARAGQALEELADHEVVHGVRAVEDHALFGQGLGEVLRGFGLAGAGGAGWRAAQVELERAHQRHVALVCERRDHEAQGVA